MISLEKRNISTPLQKLLKYEDNLGKIIVATGFKKLAKIAINYQIWSHCPEPRRRSKSFSTSPTTKSMTQKSQKYVLLSDLNFLFFL